MQPVYLMDLEIQYSSLPYDVAAAEIVCQFSQRRDLFRLPGGEFY
jgi:hypothetical protein